MIDMETRVYLPTEENISYAAQLLNEGQVVAMPTETVYGLAANAYDELAVEKIFRAKGRPQDNPLIVHIDSMQMLSTVAESVPDIAIQLADAYWPGPLTMILKKSDQIPLAVTAGLNTVAVRFPSHKVARSLIHEAQMPLAAPSANLSGHPSPTTANHVFNDLNGKIPAILDGGACEYGLESTVILIKDEENIILLRPGAVTYEMLSQTVPHVSIDKGVLNQLNAGEQALSPGMMHKHYSPKVKIVMVDSSFEKFRELIISHASENIGAMVFDTEEQTLPVPCVTYGKKEDPLLQAKLLFGSLRAVDELGVSLVYARMPQRDGIGLAIYNRMIRAAGFEVMQL